MTSSWLVLARAAMASSWIVLAASAAILSANVVDQPVGSSGGPDSESAAARPLTNVASATQVNRVEWNGGKEDMLMPGETLMMQKDGFVRSERHLPDTGVGAGLSMALAEIGTAPASGVTAQGGNLAAASLPIKPVPPSPFADLLRSGKFMVTLCLVPLPFLFIHFRSARQAAASSYQTFGKSLSHESVPSRAALNSWEVLFRGLVICTPCLAGGYNLALVGPGVASLKDTFNVEEEHQGAVPAAYCIGCIVGALANSVLVERIGRLRMHFWLSLTLYMAQLMMLEAPTFLMYAIGRALMGAAAGCAAALAPLYLAEISPKDLRGLLVSLTEQTISGGLLGGFAVAAFPSLTFRDQALFGLMFPFLALALTPTLAESPRWLAQQGRLDEAKAVLHEYVKDPKEVDETMVILRSSATRAAPPEPLKEYIQLFRNETTRMQLRWPALLMMFEELVGIEVSDNYCVRFLEQSGVPDRSIIASATVLMVFLKGVVLFLSGICLDRFGRKPPLLVSLGGQAISLVCLAHGFTQGAWRTCLVSWVLYNMFYGAGLGNVCVVVIAESFPEPRVRAVAVSFCYVLNRVVAMFLCGLYPLQSVTIGPARIFLSWATLAALAFLATLVFMGERSGTILEHTD